MRQLNYMKRGITTLNYGKNIPSELVYKKSDFPKKKIKDILRKDKISIIGYGPQGKSQALNLRDNNIPVILGLRKDGNSWKEAENDGFYQGKDLFTIEEACERSTIIMNLVSDAGQKEVFKQIKPYLTPLKSLYFSHGFGIVFNNYTDINVDNLDIDVFLVAPKGSGASVRKLFKEGSGINASYAIYKDTSTNAKEKALSIGFSIGSPYIYETTFENEVYSDLTGERSILMGGIAGLFKAQYDVLRENGHSPSEAFNETVEEALQSLYPLINENGMDYMFENCSITARRGALDWYKHFEKINKPLIEDIYKQVKEGKETSLVMDSSLDILYERQLEELKNQEIWKVGKEIRKLRK